MRKLAILFVLLAGFARAQPQLSVVGYDYYSNLNMGSYYWLTFYDIQVANVDSFATYNDSLYLVIGVEDPPGTVTPLMGTNEGVKVIAPLDTILVDSVDFYIDTTYLKEGNNTVVIWPYYDWATTATTVDSLYATIYIASINDLNPSDLNVRVGPNPAFARVVITDPDNIVEEVRLWTLEGKPVTVPKARNVIDVTGLPKGVYLFEITTSKGTLTKKLIIEK